MTDDDVVRPGNAGRIAPDGNAAGISVVSRMPKGLSRVPVCQIETQSLFPFIHRPIQCQLGQAMFTNGRLSEAVYGRPSLLDYLGMPGDKA